MRPFRTLVLSIALLAGFALAPAHAATRDITLGFSAFDPELVTAPAGDLMRWTVENGNHTIHAYAGATFAHSLVQPGDVRTTTFSGGTALYRCQFHSQIDPLSLDCQGMCGAITDRTTAPSPATITSPADGSTSATRIVRIRGTAQPQTHAVIREGGVAIGRALAKDNGIWEIDLDFQRGLHTIVARATHVNGLSAADSAPVTINVTADTQPPTATVDGKALQIGVRKPGSVGGTATDDIALASVQVRIAPLSLPGGITLAGGTKTVTTAAYGTLWRWRVEGAVPTGAWAVSARATDLAGNVGEWSEPVTVVFAPVFPLRD